MQPQDITLERALELADHASPAPWIASQALKAMRAEIERMTSVLNGRLASSCGYVPGELDRSAPARIWLQIDTDGDNSDRGERWPGAFDVTWHDEPIGGLEIQYVRADLAVPSAERLNVPEGMALVPREPSHEQIAAAAAAAWPVPSQEDMTSAKAAARILLTKHFDAVGASSLDDIAIAIATMFPAYRAMVAAAPNANCLEVA
ncbi:hypothetical protein [Dyella lutea]|uniref:Phage gp6-like head-tail connector protein n=1 Tax=Dyella lutea TaxID=2950441 RepID=A0ABT1FF32_9GAMM|nr:hypothetical protein [Dyella lutea]MCP1375989.1 hypothetical protein [Dyella lutea]